MYTGKEQIKAYSYIQYTSRQYKMICIHPMCPWERTNCTSQVFLHRGWLHAEWHSTVTETLTWDSSHLYIQEIDNSKHQMQLLCRPHSMNSCTCAQAGQQHQCDHGMLLPSQVSHPPAGSTARDKLKSGSGGKCKEDKLHMHISSVHNVWTPIVLND